MHLTNTQFKRCLLPTTLLPADEIGDDESHWQDRVSSGFDRLVAFASTELTKTGRHSIDDAGGASSASPDSGINHSSSEGSASRTFLSTSSTSSSSQMDALPPVAALTVNTVPSVKCSPAELLDSPNFPDAGLPRTPSPSASPSPLMAIYPSAGGAGSSSATSTVATAHGSNEANNSLQIPLKYQRHHQQKHYKKKFRERTWEEYDYEENASGGSVGGNEPDASTLHKSSKFRPKGKDWDWRSDQYRSNQKPPDATDAAPA